MHDGRRQPYGSGPGGVLQLRAGAQSGFQRQLSGEPRRPSLSTEKTAGFKREPSSVAMIERPLTFLQKLPQHERAIVRFIFRRIDQGDRAVFGLALEQFDQIGVLP